MNQLPPINDVPGASKGATLAEVVMSMMILAIGVLSLATLFPIGILNSVRATQLTNARVLRDNVDAYVDIHPWLVHDPDRDGDEAEHAGETFVVDPLGSVMFAPSVAPNAPLNPPSFTPQTKRYFGKLGNRASAERMTTLPDSWTELVMAVPVLPSPAPAQITSITLPITADLSVAEATLQQNVPLRIVLVDTVGRRSQVRKITGISGATVNWATAQPVGNVGNIATVRVEQFEAKYSWLLTVRRDFAGTASVDCVIFFMRAFTSDDERIFPAAITVGSNSMRLTYQDSNPNNGTFRPRYRAGGYVLDARFNWWYRIESVEDEDVNGDGVWQSGEDTLFNNGKLDLRLTLVHPAVTTSDQAMLPPNIVQVYSLGSR